jgi:hypothetical protein
MLERSDERSSALTSTRLPNPTQLPPQIRTALNLTTQQYAARFSPSEGRKPMPESPSPVPTCPHQNRKTETCLNRLSPLKPRAVVSVSSVQAQDYPSRPTRPTNPRNRRTPEPMRPTKCVAVLTPQAPRREDKSPPKEPLLKLTIKSPSRTIPSSQVRMCRPQSFSLPCSNEIAIDGSPVPDSRAAMPRVSSRSDSEYRSGRSNAPNATAAHPAKHSSISLE